MRNGISQAMVILAALAAMSPASARGEEAGKLPLKQMSDSWAVMCHARVDSPDFTDAAIRLMKLVERTETADRAEAAAVLMGRYASDNINAAALEQFGRDPFDEADIHRLLFNSKRSFSERALLKTYFRLCRREYSDWSLAPLSEATQQGMLTALAERIKSLTGKPIGYGEQRLLTHLAQSMLARFFRQASFIEAMGDYSSAAAKEDTFAASIRGWLVLMNTDAEVPTSMPDAMLALGHWDPLVRWKASSFLGRRAQSQPEAIPLAMKATEDPRDEVRAAAAGALAMASEIRDEAMIDKLVELVTRDRGVIVQESASRTLAACANQAGKALTPLLDAFDPQKQRVRPGRKRTGHILTAMAALVGQASQQDKQRMLDLARAKLRIAPLGAMKVLGALGSDAAPALSDVFSYRQAANRIHRQYIDRHVLPAIDPAIELPAR